MTINRLRQIVAVILIQVFLVNVVGIAQVSHFCLMATSDKAIAGCGSGCNSSAGCCDRPTGKQTDSYERQSCCVELVKYHQNAAVKFLAGHENELAQATNPITSMAMVSPALPPVDDPGIRYYIPPLADPGTFILISIQKFLI